MITIKIKAIKVEGQKFNVCYIEDCHVIKSMRVNSKRQLMKYLKDELYLNLYPIKFGAYEKNGTTK